MPYRRKRYRTKKRQYTRRKKYKRYRTKKRQYTKRKKVYRKRKTPLKRLRKQVRIIQSKLKNVNTHLCVRRYNISLVSFGPSRHYYIGQGVNDRASFSQVFNDFRWWDDSQPTPGWVTESVTKHQSNTSIYFAGSKLTCTLQNDNRFPLYVQWYIIECKSELVVSPIDFASIQAPDYTTMSYDDILVRFQDFPSWNKAWKITRTRRRFLKPGQTTSMSAYTKPYTMHPIDFNDYGIYSKEYGTKYIMARLHAPAYELTNDSSSGCMPEGNIMWSYRSEYNVHYNGGQEGSFLIGYNNITRSPTGVVSFTDKPAPVIVNL